MVNINNIHFRDIAAREAKAKHELGERLNRYRVIEDKRNPTPAEKAEHEIDLAVKEELQKSISNKNKKPEVCDPLFVGARYLFNQGDGLISTLLLSHENGRLMFENDEGPVVSVSLTLGLLILDGAQAPRVRVVDQKRNTTGVEAQNDSEKFGKTLGPDTSQSQWSSFTRFFYAAIGEARSLHALAERVLPILAREGDPDGPEGQAPSVDAAEFASVMRGLAEAGVNSTEPQLRRRVNEALDRVQMVGQQDSVADSSIDLPDLETISDHNIIAENVKLMGPMIVSAMFEELKVFQVVDRVVEQFQNGTLPIGPGSAGRLLYKYWRETPNRMSEAERRNFAAVTLGVPGGDPQALVNREFNDLWIRFVSSVSSFVRQNEVDQLLRSAMPSPISHQQVRKAARDLAGNLSLHGYGMAHYAARELQMQVKFMIQLLSDDEIKGCYGARDMWQVVDQVATYELGGAKTSSRYRTLATCGTIITAWLAKNVNRINSATGSLLDVDEIRNPPVRGSGDKATTNPNDYDLVNACELWLADTATSDSRVEELAQPREAPVMTSKPIQIPAMAREMLDGLGDIGAGIGLGMSTRH